MSRPLKRSFSIAGHRTSVSLEASFWDALKQIADGEPVPLAQLVARIDKQRSGCGLSTAIRLHILEHYRGLAVKRATECLIV